MKKIFLKFGASLVILQFFLLPVTALALSPAQATKAIPTAGELLTNVGDNTGQGVPKELTSTIGKLIQVVLSVLGIVFLVIVVYAGFLYLTAGGEDEKVKTAKKLLSQAVIGIVIVLLSFAISTFVIGRLTSI